MMRDARSTLPRAKELVFLAGANGAGKTTFAQRYVEQRFPYWPQVNADRVLEVARSRSTTLGLPQDPVGAANTVDTSVLCLALLGEPLIVETVLSSEKYRLPVRMARRSHLIFRVVYIATVNPQINVRRVAARVAAGGHDVPVDRIVARWHRSLQTLPWFLEQADRVAVIDNSQATPRLVAVRHLGGPLEVIDRDHPATQLLRPLVGSLVVAPDA